MSLHIFSRRSIAFIKQNVDSSYEFHHCAHTKYVVNKTKLLCRSLNLSEEEMDLASIAAWGHDLGYHQGQEGHEERSSTIVLDWMKKNQYTTDQQAQVKLAILSTKIPQSASTTIAKCLCDADLAHLGSPKYFEWTKKLQNEWINTGLYNNNQKQLLDVQISFLSKHNYWTPFAIKYWKPRKLRSLEALRLQRSKL